MAAAGLAQALPFHGSARAVPSTAPRLSCMLWTLTRQFPFERCVEIVAAAGYNGVELVGEFHNWTPEARRAHLQQLRSLNLVVDASSGMATGFAEPGQTEPFLRQLTKQIQWMKELACPQIILLSGKRDNSLSPAAQREVALDNLKRAADLAAASHLQLLIEPIDRLEDPAIYMASVAQAFDLVRTVNRPNVQVLFDLYHEQRGFGNLTDQLTANLALVGLLHIADVPGRHDPGTGELNYTNIYKKLAELQYDSYIAMEFYPTGEPVAALRAARQQVLTAFQS